jgi:polyvinyl alcohol dehydrogenase (cytochrome)
VVHVRADNGGAAAVTAILGRIEVEGVPSAGKARGANGGMEYIARLEVWMAMRLTITTVVTGLVLAALAAPALAQAPDGEAAFQKACASCHLQPAADSRAPNRDALRALAPEAIVTALTVGNMFRQGAELSDAERRAVAGFLAGRPVGSPGPPSIVGRCTTAAPSASSLAAPAGWNGWGGDVTNTRYQPTHKGGLTAPQVPQLKLKWAFGFAGVNSARGQPAVAGGRIFVANENGDVHALNAKTGCTYWTYHAQAGIRTAVSVGPYTGANGTSGYAVYFADGRAVAYAVDASTGRQIWTRKVDEHTYAGATGSPALHAGRLYVPTSAVGEEGQGGRAQYQCCTFRGSVTALDGNTGAVVWKSYVITEEPKPRSLNKEGVQTWGPAGGGIWSAPTIDAARRAVYVATGNGYSSPPQPTTDAVIALDMDTGRIRWVNQPFPNDVWAGGCRPENPDNPNCPEKLGPDHDFSMSPVLAKRSNGQDILIVQQKAGMAYAFDPDKQGALLWQYRTGQGSGLGGQWGSAADATQAYFGVADTLSKTPGGMRAVKIDTGEEVWSKPPSERLCGTARGCSAAQGAAVTAIPGVVFSASMDGGVRAYAATDGAIIWQFDTNREFETVNGVPAKGGAIDGAGPVVADGMLYLNSGYVSLIGRPGNVLLAFGAD